MTTRILALDTATTTGWAVGPDQLASGSHTFTPADIDRAALPKRHRHKEIVAGRGPDR